MCSSSTLFVIIRIWWFWNTWQNPNIIYSRNRPGQFKGTVSRDFLLQVFSWITFPQAPDKNIRIISNFFENSRRYSQVKVHHRCQRHRWQIIGTISGCRHLKVNLKAKIYTYVSSTTQRWQNKIFKIFLIEDFFHLPPVSLTPVANPELRISPRIFGLNGILWGWGQTDSWKEPEAKNLVTLSL